MTHRVVLATRNEGKIAELRRILESAGLDVELVGAEAFAALPDVAETGSTFAANALLKARAVAAYTGLPSIADDSGLCVDALNGLPGILSARWAGRHGDDEANLDLVLAQLSDTPDERRGAHFFCAAAVAMPPGHHGELGEARVVEGQIDGSLMRERSGNRRIRLRPDLRALRIVAHHRRDGRRREGRHQPPRPGLPRACPRARRVAGRHRPLSPGSSAHWSRCWPSCSPTPPLSPGASPRTRNLPNTTGRWAFGPGTHTRPPFSSPQEGPFGRFGVRGRSGGP